MVETLLSLLNAWLCPRIWALVTLQDGVRRCHSKCRTAQCYQISSEREGKTSLNSTQAKCTVSRRDSVSYRFIRLVQQVSRLWRNRWQHAYIQPTAVTNVNIRFRELTFEKNRRLYTVWCCIRYICRSVWSVQTVVHKYIFLKTV
jgi:hypothetical protein